MLYKFRRRSFSLFSTNIEYLASRPDREPLPNTDDLAAASEAVARLAHVYRLNTTALAEGGHLVLEVLTSYHHPLSGIFFISRRLFLIDHNSRGLV